MNSLDDAVKAARLYAGALDLPVKTQQRLYEKAKRLVAKVSTQRGVDYSDAYAQIFDRAASLGPLCPTPGKDI